MIGAYRPFIYFGSGGGGWCQAPGPPKKPRKHHKRCFLLSGWGVKCVLFPPFIGQRRRWGGGLAHGTKKGIKDTPFPHGVGATYQRLPNPCGHNTDRSVGWRHVDQRSGKRQYQLMASTVPSAQYDRDTRVNLLLCE